MSTNDKHSHTEETTTTKEIPVQDDHAVSRTTPAGMSKPVLIALLVAGAIFLLLGGTAAGFIASRVLDRDRPGSRGMMLDDGNRGGFRHRGGMMPRGEFGKVTKVSSNSITITDDHSGGSVTFSVTSDTSVKDKDGNAAKISDIKTGDTVAITATSATNDGAAGTIVINPTRPAGSTN